MAARPPSRLLFVEVDGAAAGDAPHEADPIGAAVRHLHDQMTDGSRFCVLVIVDDCTRECLALVLDTSISPP